ncbi:BlaI/MecI/CopY family transcriptional regulator [Robertkochia solimangrovi]|uniref:BlaI/MecI/CopY family transcriptional regulator n=1 Tax=Robertkochia solimangrovi TaxID=2213046 RepID=UPI001180F449|nr:BlaI/MecI/CopY family transcriptional regulator [Robertkochia solimangrovi]TRZ41635.1 BlaI/MecI/CopY family transcriptional regulator [Robertkochia solimangrovi]
MKQLNRTELEIMKYLWKLDKCYLKDIVEEFPEPKPAYTTISTLINRMVKKGYIGFEKKGRDKEYFPVLKRNDYFKNHFKDIVSNFFNDSSSQFASFFTRNTDMTLEELEELESILKEKISRKKND